MYLVIHSRPIAGGVSGRINNMKKYLLVVSFLVAIIFISPNISLAQIAAPSVAELQARIAALLAQIQALQAQLNQQQGTQPQWCYDFNVNLKIDSTSEEVRALHIALKKEGFDIPETQAAPSKPYLRVG